MSDILEKVEEMLDSEVIEEGKVGSNPSEFKRNTDDVNEEMDDALQAYKKGKIKASLQSLKKAKEFIEDIIDIVSQEK